MYETALRRITDTFPLSSAHQRFIRPKFGGSGLSSMNGGQCQAFPLFNEVSRRRAARMNNGFATRDGYDIRVGRASTPLAFPLVFCRLTMTFSVPNRLQIFPAIILHSDVPKIELAFASPLRRKLFHYYRVGCPARSLSLLL